MTSKSFGAFSCRSTRTFMLSNMTPGVRSHGYTHLLHLMTCP